MNLETVAKSKLCCSQLQHNISQICMFLQLFKQNTSGVLCYTKQYLSCEQKIQNYLSAVTKESKRVWKCSVSTQKLHVLQSLSILI